MQFLIHALTSMAVQLVDLTVWMSNYIQYKTVPVMTYPCHDLSQCMLVHYDDVKMTMLASQITSLMVVYSIVYSGVNQRKHQSSASLAFVREIHRGPVNFPHKWAVTRKMFPFDDVIMKMWQAIARTSGTSTHCIYMSGLILGLCRTNERCRYKVTPSLMGWAQT